MTGIESRLTRSREVLVRGWVAFNSLENRSPDAAKAMQEVWRRPARHNVRIERAALRYTVILDGHCRNLTMHGRHRTFLVPPLSDPAKRYDIEAAVRTIPDLVPFTQDECERIRGSQFYTDGYHTGPQDISNTEPELLARWHEWLWTPKDDPSQRASEPNPEAEALAAGYTRLAEAMLGAVVLWQASYS